MMEKGSALEMWQDRLQKIEFHTTRNGNSYGRVVLPVNRCSEFKTAYFSPCVRSPGSCNYAFESENSQVIFCLRAYLSLIITRVRSLSPFHPSNGSINPLHFVRGIQYSPISLELKRNGDCVT